VERDEAFAAGDVFEEGLFLLRENFGCVGIDEEAGVFVERGGVQVFGLVGVRQVDAAFFQNGLDLREARRRLVMAVVTEEENF
jgi:hypothetical protein